MTAPKKTEAAKPEAEVTKSKSYVVAKGSLTSLKGIVAAGEPITPEHFKDAATFDHWLKAGHIKEA